MQKFLFIFMAVVSFYAAIGGGEVFAKLVIIVMPVSLVVLCAAIAFTLVKEAFNGVKK